MQVTGVPIPFFESIFRLSEHSIFSYLKIVFSCNLVRVRQQMYLVRFRKSLWFGLN